MKTKKIVIDEKHEVFLGEDEETIKKYAGEYVIRKWSFKVKNDVLNRSTVVGKDGNISVVPGNLQTETVLACIYSAPFTVSRKLIGDMPAELGDLLFMAISDLNGAGLTEGRKKN